jgi:hypothetical protein
LPICSEFGSPNVFGQFAPHVTLAWGADVAAVAAAVSALQMARSSFLGMHRFSHCLESQ